MTITDEMIEAAAKASYDYLPFPGDFAAIKWGDLSDFDRNIYKVRARATLTAVVPLLQQDWQPIETAPKDGTVIVVYCPPMEGDKIFAVTFNADCHDRPGAHGRFVWSMQGGDGGIAENVPSHWLPLPDPPKTKL